MFDNNENFIHKLKIYTPQQIKLIEKAYEFAKTLHVGQKRESGEEYFTHPVDVATILMSMNLDAESVCSALLHDTVEDTGVSLDKIEKEFGKEISYIVNGVTKLTRIRFESNIEKNAENFRKLLMAISGDIRVLIIKLADRLHNMQTLKHKKDKEKRKKIANETLIIFAPLAQRIGMYNIKNKLEDLAFEQLYPEERKAIIGDIGKTKETKKDIIEYIIHKLKDKIKKENIKCIIYGREKKPYSIWKKMRKKNVSFENLFDIIAFRILVDSVQECYKTLGIINSEYRMIPNTFKDYISNPKENGYQSLHTIVLGPKNIKIEAQIRTYEMHQVAEYGVASHWLYKQGQESPKDLNKYKWIRDILSEFEKSQNISSTFKNTRLSFHQDEVFCFTPVGDIFNLPKNATVLDFAYAIHSDVGNKCSGGKINGNIAQLKTELSNGDQVEILTSQRAHPYSSWLNLVKTTKARSEIKHYIRTQKLKDYEILGRKIIQKFCEELKLKISDKIIEQNLSLFKQNTVNEIYAFVGEGIITKQEFFKKVFPEEFKKQKVEKKEIRLKKKSKEQEKTKQKDQVSIEGLVKGMAIKFAKCCYPVPGDDILGIINTGIGITIHKINCRNIKNIAVLSEKSIPLTWKNDCGVSDEKYVARVEVILDNKSGKLATIINILAEKDINILNINTSSKMGDVQAITLEIKIQNTTQLADILASIRSLKSVYSIKRC